MKLRRNVVAICIALALSACAASGAGDPAAEAQAAFERQDFLDARDRASVALQSTPDDAGLLWILAKSQVAIGESDGALRTIDRLEKAGEASGEIALLRAEVLLQQNRTEQARVALKDLDSADAWRLRALAAIREGDDNAAEAAFARGLKAPGERFRLRATEANWLVDHGFADRAEKAIKELKQTAPGRIETLFVTARLAQLRGDSDQALANYQSILEKAPTDRPALLGAIAELGAQRRIAELRPLVERGRKAMPDDLEFLFLTARLKAEEGKWAEVRSLLQQSESRLPDNPDARALYAQALLEEGQAELARSHLGPLYRTYPDVPGFAEAYARALEQTGDPEEARRVRAHKPVDDYEDPPA